MKDKKNALVLGGTTGIGLETMELMHKTGAWDRIEGYGRMELDVVERGDIRTILIDLRPQTVVYSVGITQLDWIRDIDPMTFARIMEVNVWGFLQIIQLLDQVGCGPANVVAVTSDAAWRPMRTSSIYCASKSALEMAVRVASREYAELGWRINAVAPGKVADTPMTEYVDGRVLQIRGWTAESAEQYELSSSPIRRKVTKGEVAQVIVHTLLGPAAQTGEIIAINGGR